MKEQEAEQNAKRRGKPKPITTNNNSNAVEPLDGTKSCDMLQTGTGGSTPLTPLTPKTPSTPRTIASFFK